MNDKSATEYILIKDEPEFEECPECGLNALCVFKLTAMNNAGVGDMESTIRRCLKCHVGDDPNE